MKHLFIFEIEKNMCAERKEIVEVMAKTRRLATIKLQKIMDARSDIFYWHINWVRCENI